VSAYVGRSKNLKDLKALARRTGSHGRSGPIGRMCVDAQGYLSRTGNLAQGVGCRVHFQAKGTDTVHYLHS